ncbi:TetR/AcrR family transcriptional regulator [Salipiger mangrovisoli]|nr:TetR family transcriptional regulator [Salipiger mangrovisoli]
MVQYATAAEDKEARRDVILEAALALFLEDTRRLPTVAAVAARSGLAKGTVYLYFDSKEQIFASLLVRDWRDFIGLISGYFASATGTPEQRLAGFIEVYVAHILDHPALMRLDSMGYAMLEPALSDAALADFKLRFSGALEEAGRAMEAALDLRSGEGLTLLFRTYAMTRGLWQLSDLPEAVRAFPGFAGQPFARVDFGRDLSCALADYWRGAWQAARSPARPEAQNS